ncbi:DNA-binding protein [Rhodoferax sp. TBRC 17660]|uniref:DNA-binding protein n=1 Tax=Rhodoferax potami TaxID=3068338 RepID=A0ABU3KSZ4_9BURK|nr:DNA-binding protein [Rhodoferax sp. TBRC 17660]MDT7520581.1 DNA-binding protein [Rhodoferax sp. TBRC 17660]
MPRPSIATPAQVRETISILLRESGLSSGASSISFRRAVSVRKVRERLGGGNPATIAHEINAVEKDFIGSDAQQLSIPDLPADIAALMAQLWQAAVGVQLTEVLQLKKDAHSIADAAKSALVEEQLRNQVLLQELAEMRSATAEHNAQLAQATSQMAVLADQNAGLQRELDASREREAALQAAQQSLATEQTGAIAAARERYDGLSKQLLQETAQQRQAAQVEVTRMTTQAKFAEKREASLSGRIEQLEADLLEVRSQRDKAAGEVSALKYINTSLKIQVDEFLKARTGEKVLVVPPNQSKRRASAKGPGRD